jgi:hypothetical protein
MEKVRSANVLLDEGQNVVTVLVDRRDGFEQYVV